MAVTNGWGQGVINNTNGWGKLATNSINAGSIYQDSASGDTALIGTSAAFSYSASTFTQADADPTPTITGTAGGTFSGTSGLVFVSTSTGEIDLSASTIAAHVVTYTVGGVSSNFNLSVTAVPYSNVYSLDFDGVDDFINCGTGLSLLGSACTFSAWVNMDTALSFRVLHKGIGADREYAFGCGTSSTLFLLLYNGTSNGIGQISTANLTPQVGSWTHIAATYDGSGSNTGVVLYVNGSVVSSSAFSTGSYTAPSSNAGGDVLIGAYSTERANGNIDEVSVFNSVQNIATLYNSGVPGDLSSLNPTAWYRMGENGSWKSTQWLLPENSNKDKVSNYSFEFDGVGDNINLGTSILDGLGALSISFWFNTSYDGWQFFLGDNSFRINMNQANDDVRLRFNNNLDYRADPLPVTLNTWNNIVVVFDGSLTQANRLKLYLNGSLATNILSGTADTTFVASNNFRLGRVGSFSGNQFVGMMDDVAFFNTALTSGNVTSIYNSGTPTTLPAGAVAHYKMGEDATFSTNWTVSDAVGSNDGTSANMTIEDRVGDAPNSSNNSLSYNMDEVDRETDVPS